NELVEGAAMNFYRVRAIVDEGIVRPDIPDDVPFVGNTDGQWYLIATPAELLAREGCQRCHPVPDAVEAVAQDLGIDPADPLNRWWSRKEAERRGPVHRKVGRRQRRRPAS